MAAQTLEKGKLYQEAATIYIKYIKDNRRAAECYENGNMIEPAIQLYKELNENEKIGDLYLKINNKKDADIYYEKVAQKYLEKDKYIKASLIYKNKIKDTDLEQSVLLKGWRSNKDAYNCLINYFTTIDDNKALKNEIESIYKKEVNELNSLVLFKLFEKLKIILS